MSGRDFVHFCGQLVSRLWGCAPKAQLPRKRFPSRLRGVSHVIVFKGIFVSGRNMFGLIGGALGALTCTLQNFGEKTYEIVKKNKTAFYIASSAFVLASLNRASNSRGGNRGQNWILREFRVAHGRFFVFGAVSRVWAKISLISGYALFRRFVRYRACGAVIMLNLFTIYSKCIQIYSF